MFFVILSGLCIIFTFMRNTQIQLYKLSPAEQRASNSQTQTLLVTCSKQEVFMHCCLDKKTGQNACRGKQSLSHFLLKMPDIRAVQIFSFLILVNIMMPLSIVGNDICVACEHLLP